MMLGILYKFSSLKALNLFNRNGTLLGSPAQYDHFGNQLYLKNLLFSGRVFRSKRWFWLMHRYGIETVGCLALFMWYILGVKSTLGQFVASVQQCIFQLGPKTWTDAIL